MDGKTFSGRNRAAGCRALYLWEIKTHLCNALDAVSFSDSRKLWEQIHSPSNALIVAICMTKSKPVAQCGRCTSTNYEPQASIPASPLASRSKGAQSMRTMWQAPTSYG